MGEDFQRAFRNSKVIRCQVNGELLPDMLTMPLRKKQPSKRDFSEAKLVNKCHDVQFGICRQFIRPEVKPVREVIPSS